MDVIGVIIAGIIIGLLGKFVAPGDRNNIPLWLPSRHPVTQPSASPATCVVALVDEVKHGVVNHPSINGMQAIRGSCDLSSPLHLGYVVPDACPQP